MSESSKECQKQGCCLSTRLAARGGEYAIVKLNGRAEHVQKGQVVRIEQRQGANAETPETLELSEVLLVKRADSETPVIGSPTVAGAKVTLKVLGNNKGKKLIAFKRKRRQGFLKKIGHRAHYLEATVTEIA